jgi:hypothetical protein
MIPLDPTLGVSLACLLALLGYLGLLLEHLHEQSDPDKHRKRMRAAYATLAMATLISLTCAVFTSQLVRGLPPTPPLQQPAPFTSPAPTDDYSKLAGSAGRHHE